MKKNRSIYILICLISVLSVVVSLVGILSSGGPGSYDFQAITGEQVSIYGIGIYALDSVSVASQGIASDVITLFIGVPLLILSLILWHKESFRGTLLLTGTLGYFLYTYTSYVFLWMYNPLFIVYVALMSLSLFSFIIMMMSMDYAHITTYFSPKLSIKLYATYQYLIGIFLFVLWMGKIFPSISEGATPVGLEHYTTLVIQGMDLGFIVPVAILSATLLIKKKPMGYVITSVVLVKGFTMLLAISGMMINMMIHDVTMEIVPTIMFFTLAVVSIFIFIKLLSQTIPHPEST